MKSRKTLEKGNYRDAKGRYIKGLAPGRPLGALSKETRFKNRIFEIINDRDREVIKAKIEKLLDIAASFVPKKSDMPDIITYVQIWNNHIEKIKEVDDTGRIQNIRATQ